MKSKQITATRWAGGIFILLTVLMGLAILLQTASIYYDGMDAKETAREETRRLAQAEGWSQQVTELKVSAAANAIPIYSRTIVGERLRQLIPFAAAWLVGLVGLIAVTLWAHIPKPAPERAPQLMQDQRLRKQKRRLPSRARAGCEADFDRALTALQTVRSRSRTLLAVTAGVGVACLGVPLLYFLDRSNFPNENINQEVLHAALFSLPFLLLMLAGALTMTYLQGRLLSEEAEAIRETLCSGERPPTNPERPARGRVLRLTVRICLLAAGLGLVVLGCFNGSVSEVLEKATRICTECIGLG